jgi:iron uptake system EfeUOB component EfeO/EfeM
MRAHRYFTGMVLLGCLLWAGCERKASFTGDASQLESVFQLTSTSQGAGADPSTYKDAQTPALVKSLVDAIRSNDMDTAAPLLHVLNFRGPGLSYDQFNAIRLAFGDVSTELAHRAANGDEHAKDLMQKMSP